MKPYGIAPTTLSMQQVMQTLFTIVWDKSHQPVQNTDGPQPRLAAIHDLRFLKTKIENQKTSPIENFRNEKYLKKTTESGPKCKNTE